jgi:hypothetical protein
MTAFDLIDSIFSRPAWGVAPNVRRISREQLVYLRGLIDRDAEAGKARKGAPGSLVWMPPGPHKYVLSEDLGGDRHTLTRLSNIAASQEPSLF